MSDKQFYKPLPKKVYTKWLHEELKNSRFDSSIFFFVTVTFSEKRKFQRSYHMSDDCKTFSEFDAFHHLYNLMCNHLFGCNFHRYYNQRNLPAVISCIDVSGTKFWSKAGEITNPHIHSVWQIDEKYKKEFMGFFADDKNIDFFESKLDIDGLEAVSVPQKDLKRVISYASKFLKFNQANMEITEDLRIYPNDSYYLQAA